MRPVVDPQICRRLWIARLNPRLARTGLVGRGQPLRDDALQPELTGGLVHFVTVTLAARRDEAQPPPTSRPQSGLARLRALG